jgi:hypothetical protein
MAMNQFIAGNAKSRTSWFAIALMAIGAAEQSGLFEFIPPDYKGLALSIVGFVTLVLRNLTTTAVTDK